PSLISGWHEVFRPHGGDASRRCTATGKGAQMLFVEKKTRRFWLLAVCTLMLAACGQDAPAPGPVGSAAGPTVTEYQVQAGEWIDQIEALGTARANESVTLTAKVTEVVRSVRF